MPRAAWLAHYARQRGGEAGPEEPAAAHYWHYSWHYFHAR